MKKEWQEQQEDALNLFDFYNHKENLEPNEKTIKELIKESSPIDGNNAEITANKTWEYRFINYEFEIKNADNISYCYHGFVFNDINFIWYFIELLTTFQKEYYFFCEEEGPGCFFYLQSIDEDKVRFIHISDRKQQPTAILTDTLKVHQDFIIPRYNLVKQFYSAIKTPIDNTIVNQLDQSQGIDIWNRLIKDSEIVKNYLNIHADKKNVFK